MSEIVGNAFITARKGTCYLSIKIGRRNADLMKIRQYKIDPDEKRQVRRLYPNVTFDWKKITAQLAHTREDCRDYRSRRRKTSVRGPRTAKPFYGIYDPLSRTVYVNDPDHVAGRAALLDVLIAHDKQ